ncbi:integral membrane protein MviN [Gloeomargarita lithophora Alchichica-D10]|uniref:Probable lipid II flippase MurJ n=1 Tax=Gloeomargarita lithophora Alchichica-D10 TaxID=1188229 RepID=A0A1J0ACJ1_9CYAN|nr:murein biosynthesis integral membrane protein MurJ [Gloeomargarita lithophora]APB33632.1 integral membrane protein MviN [Gloeomargarita lithophora Alchichica-D10]
MTRSLARIAGLVAVATFLSKLLGLFREQAIAAAFGVGAVADAYSYAYVIPGFLLILLGGINGPFHSAIVSVVSKYEEHEAAVIVETVLTWVTVFLLVLSIGMVLGAEPLMQLVAPGLSQSTAGQATQSIAVAQLRILAPLAVLAGWIGIGFGVLTARDQYWLPAISPIFSSVSVLAGLGGAWLWLGNRLWQTDFALLGGQVLAGSILAGAVGQWLVQLRPQAKMGIRWGRLRWNWRHPGVQSVLNVLLPATFASGMLHINVYVDLQFASYIPQAAAALGYANLLVQAPLGILSNMILVPYLPVFSRLTDPQDWPELTQRIRQSLVLVALVMVPLGVLLAVLALPVVRVVYERYAFDGEASRLVGGILAAYGIGMFVYLGRDVLVRVFYALGDGETPFRLSLLGIGLNAGLNWVFVRAMGAPGLALATAGVNLVTFIGLFILLQYKLQILPWRNWLGVLAQITGASGVAGAVAWGLWHWGAGVLGTLLGLVVAGSAGLLVFAGIIMRCGIPETGLLADKILARWPGRR